MTFKLSNDFEIRSGSPNCYEPGNVTEKKEESIKNLFEAVFVKTKNKTNKQTNKQTNKLTHIGLAMVGNTSFKPQLKKGFLNEMFPPCM